MSEIVIKVNNLGKKYNIGELQKYKSLRDSITKVFSSPFKKIKNTLSKNQNTESNSIWALKDISFEVKKGEIIGIIGRNGAGKSTLLKILSRITEPTEGYAKIYGRLGSLLEVGTGFHPELTGRENIYLNGAILGMKKNEINQKFDDIVSFAEMEKFIDTPVKFYSSGMYVRLAFAVAAHLEPEILLVDEVLAVGDALFQKKCMGKMEDVASQGRTIFFVSHGMDAIRSLCSRVIWLENGKIFADGPSEKTVSDYLDYVLHLNQNTQKKKNKEDQNNVITIDKVILRNSNDIITNRFTFSDDLHVEIHYFAKEKIEKPYFWIGIGEENSIFGAISLLDGIRPDSIEGNGVIKCVFYGVRLLPRFYNVFMGIRDQSGTSNLFSSSTISHFEILGHPSELGLNGKIADAFIKTCAPISFPYKWELPNGKQIFVDPTQVDSKIIKQL